MGYKIKNIGEHNKTLHEVSISEIINLCAKESWFYLNLLLE